MSNEIKHISGAAGGYLVGNSHKNGGIQAINKAVGKPLEMEGGEVVITKPAVEDNELREFEGKMLTNRQILSKINESGGGVSFAELGAELPTKIEFCGTEYKYGGETLTDYEIAHRISKCGCSHEEDSYADGGELESIISEKFTQGYGKVKYLEISESGGNWKYIHNPNMTVSQRKNAPVFTVESSEEDRKLAQENRINYENNLPTEISILDYAKKVAKSNNAIITHKSNSGSVYLVIKNPSTNSDEHFKTIRISDHYILDRDSLNPKSRYDYEIVQKNFYENDSTDLKEIFEEDIFANGGNLEKDLKDNAVNVAVNATDTLPLMEKGGEISNNEFNYMMLSRLKTDNDYFLGNGKIEYLVNDLPEEVIKYIESLPTPLEIGNKTTKPQIGQILDFGEGFEEVTRIVNHKGIDFIEAKKTDGSDNRLNLYPLSDYEKTLENQGIYKGFRELREKDQLQRDKYFKEQQNLAKTQTTEFNDIDGFAEDKTALEKGKILKYLNKSYQIDGKLLTIKQEIRDAINNNGFVNENAQKEKTIRYTKDDRTFILSDQLQTKIGIEYAEYLIKKRNMNSSAKTYQISDYKNPYEINRAIEALLDSKENDFTPNEIEFISHYSGYGGLEKQGSFSDEELKGLLYEYFTPDAVVKKMWALAYKYGFGTFSNPHIMEPSVGTGNFFKYAPTDAEIFGNEINDYSKRVCEILYPKAMITLQPFEKNFISKNNSIKNKLNDIHKYHLVIGNPPYGRAVSKYLAMGESDYTKATSFTEYFITRGLDLLHPGGLLIFVVGAEQYNGGTLFLDSGISVVKKNIFDKAQLVDAYRLPTKIFERTGVASEILVFKKK